MARAKAAPKAKSKTAKAKTARKRVSGRQVELSIGVRARPEGVWQALATAPGLGSWLARDAKIEPNPGSAYRFSWGDATLKGDVLEVEPGRRLDLSWHHDTTASFRIARRHHGRETVVTLRHTGIPAALGGVELYAQLRQSWTFSLVNLKSVLERGVDLRERDRRRTFAKGWANCWD